MGTRSVVAIPTDNGFKGKYVHWDGYPTAMAKNLHALVAQHGVEAVRCAVVDEHGGWSSIDPTATSMPSHYDPERFEVVPGVGIAYTPQEQPLDTWISSGDEDNGWVEWGYVLNDTHLSVLRPPQKAEGAWEHVGDLPWAQEATQERLQALEDAGYGR
jgi:hypothetical protein